MSIKREMMVIHQGMVHMARMQTFQDKVPELFERARGAATRNDNRNLSRILQRIIEKSSSVFAEAMNKAKTHSHPTTRLDLIAQAHMEHFNAIHGCYRVACVGRAISPKRRADMFEMTYSIEWSLYTWTVAERLCEEYMPATLIERLLNTAEQFGMTAVKASIFQWQCVHGASCIFDDRATAQAIEALYQPLPSVDAST